MKFTYSWLREYIDIDLAPQEVADHLTMLGLEVDAVEDLYPDLPGVKVAKIEAVHPHPNADKLVLCDVNIGDVQERVVCGAPNARAGLTTAIATTGAVLPGGFKVKPAKIRGEKSNGMLCSAKELGISVDHAGIMELPSDLMPGQELAEALNLKDTLIEVDLTPNRPDCASVLGTAREVGGVIGKKMTPPVNDVPELTGENVDFAVEVESAADCLRYAARLIRNVKIGPSPWWLQQKLMAVGLRPINNVVDITNFVMLEYGQPLHAFDFTKLAGAKIVVRRAKSGEKMNTLDGVERELDDAMLLICDGEKPVAVAGVMGGENSEVDESTSDILLESACFDAISIRRTAAKLNMSTDASYRFERGVDPQMAPKAMERAITLVAELTGGTIAPNGIDFKDGVKDPDPLTLRVGRTNDLLGIDLSADAMAKCLTGIEIEVEKKDEDTLKVCPPSFRVDLEREVDLVEEIARIVGYNDIPTTLPMVPMSFPDQDKSRTVRKQVSQVMTSLGFSEAINYSFVTPKHFDMLGLGEDDSRRKTVTLLNPLGEEQSIMRTTLLPGLLENVRRNLNHQCPDVRLYEVGKVFLPGENEQPHEPLHLAAVLCGRRQTGSPLLHGGSETTDLLDVKGVLEQLLVELRHFEIVFEVNDKAASAYVAEGREVMLKQGDKVVGTFGAIDKGVLKAFSIKQQVYYVEVDLAELESLAPAAKAFSPLPKFPSVKWDLALLVPDSVGGGEMVAAINECGESIVERADIFDIFQGKSVEQGMKSVAISITYRSADATLDDETVGKVHQKITDMLMTRFHGKMREA